MIVLSFVHQSEKQTEARMLHSRVHSYQHKSGHSLQSSSGFESSQRTGLIGTQGAEADTCLLLKRLPLMMCLHDLPASISLA